MNPNRRSGWMARRSAELAPTPPYIRYAACALAFATLAGCSDRDPIVAPGVPGPHFSQETSSPVVNSVADQSDGACDDAGTGNGCTLREAIDFAAASGSTITFDPALTAAGPQVITLGSQLQIQKSVTIVGPGAQLLTVRRAVDAESEFGIIDIRGNVTVEIRGLTISGGRGDSGAGIASFFTNDFVTLKGVVISGNATTSSGGGAIITGAQMTIDSSTISGNQANGTRGKGGGIYTLGGNLMVTNSTISGNSATDIGGGIFQNGGTVGLMNVTLTGNSAQIGGGFGKEAYPALFIHVTVAGNGASVYGGIYALTGREPIGLVNTIVANNGGGNCGGFGAASITDGGGNLVYPATARCDGIVPATTGDPKLGSLSLNAPGTTATMALGAGSAAIDAAIASVCATQDQRGVARPQGAGCDIGAYEAEPSSDVTPPVITPSIDGVPGSNGWYRSDVTVTWSVNDGESAVASAPCPPTTISTDTQGQDVTCSATSAGGTNTQTVTIKRDGTVPTLAPVVSPNPVLLNGTATATPNATDQRSGLASASCGAPTTTTVGSKSVSCTATDYAGNTNTVAANYTVAYPFTGFLQPVDPMPTVNVVKAGAAVQVTFGLGGNRGLAIFAAGSPASQSVSCSASAPQDDIEATVTAGNSSLAYDASTQQYSYTWKTDKAWAGTCRMLNLTLADGTTHQASFKLK